MTADGITLKEYMDRQFGRIDESLKDIQAKLVGRDNFTAACEKIKELQDGHNDHEKRLVSIERISWLLGVIGALLVGVLSMLLYGLVNGTVMVMFK